VAKKLKKKQKSKKDLFSFWIRVWQGLIANELFLEIMFVSNMLDLFLTYKICFPSSQICLPGGSA
jgi:hypothetical protein